MAPLTPNPHFDVAVVGGGPAGMSAAVAAVDGGASVVLLDAGLVPGGQYWRHPEDPELSRAVSRHHHSLRQYTALKSALESGRRAGHLTLLPRHSVWHISGNPGNFVIRSVDEGSAPELNRNVASSAVILAPGAYDRQVPFPGWDLPGVMAAGGVQALIKGNNVVPSQRLVVAGTGPFLLSVGAGLASAGANVLGIFEASQPWHWSRHMSAMARNPGKLIEGASYAASIMRHRVPYKTGHTVLSAHGNDRLESITVARINGRGVPVRGTARNIKTEILAVGWGFNPQIELAVALGCATRVDEDGNSVIEVNTKQQTNVPGVFVAGEACGIGGSELAVVEGRIAGASASGSCSKPQNREERLRARKRKLASALQSVYPTPSTWIARLPDDVVICRCEEVSAGALRNVAADPITASTRSAKLMTRAGMGWCQGRMCGFAISCMIDAQTGNAATESLTNRPISMPIRLELLNADDASPHTYMNLEPTEASSTIETRKTNE